MRIMYVAASPVPSYSANSVHVVKMCQAFVQNAHEVMLVSPEYNRRDTLGGDAAFIYHYYGIDTAFPVKTTYGALKGRAGAAIHALQTLAYTWRYRPDIVYTRCFSTALLLSVFGLPVLFERHDIFRQSGLSGRLFPWMARRRSFQGIVVISRALKDHMAASYDISPSRFLVAPDGADALAVREGPALPPVAGLHIGYIGHLYKGRGIDLILNVAARFPMHAFHIIGGLPDDVAYWTRQSAHLRNVTLYGHLPHAQAIPYLQSFDMLLAPYQNAVAVEGGGDTARWMSPLKIFEYMSSGKPMICSDIPVLKEVLHHDVNCQLCPPDDPDAWCKAISRYADDPAFAREVGQRAQEIFVRSYTWKARAAACIDFLARRQAV